MKLETTKTNNLRQVLSADGKIGLQQQECHRLFNSDYELINIKQVWKKVPIVNGNNIVVEKTLKKEG